MPGSAQSPEQLFRAKTAEISQLLHQINQRLEVYDHNLRLIYVEQQAMRRLLTEIVRGQGGSRALQILREGTKLADAIGNAWRP